MANYSRSFGLVLFLVCGLFMLPVSAQIKYSKNALTGRGDLVLKGDTFKLQPEVYTAFRKMQVAALKDSISIFVVSAYRSFNQQKIIWNRKYKNYIEEGLSPEEAINKIVEYSTLPGTSRHHWGTEIDIIDDSVIVKNGLLKEENYSENGPYSKLKEWMDIHSKKFGFYLVYDNNPYRKGFKYEPWHYSYRPISKPMFQAYTSRMFSTLYSDINLNGSQFLTNEFLNTYYLENILGINEE